MIRLFIVLACLLSPVFAQNIPSLTITSGFAAPESDLIGNIMKEVSKRSKINIHYDSLPNKRSLLNANTGITDGESSRIWEINNYYPNLVRVPAQSHSIDLVVLTKRKIILKGPSELSQYNVGVIHGMKIAVLLAEKNKPLSLLKATDHETLIRMLIADRLDVIITNKSGLLSSLDMIKGHNLYLREEPLMTRPLYMQLHKKNQAYIPQLKAALDSMHEDGTYQRIQNDFFQPYQDKLEKSVHILKY